LLEGTFKNDNVQEENCTDMMFFLISFLLNFLG